MSTGTVVSWLRSQGDVVEQGEPLLSVLTDKVDVEMEAPTSGVLLRVLVSEGDEVPVGTVLAWIGKPGEELPPEAGASTDQSQPLAIAPAARSGPVPPAGAESGEPARVPRASPAVRRLASRYGIDLATVPGSGPEGLITRKDLEAALSGSTSIPVPNPRPRVDASSPGEEVVRQPLQGLRKIMSRRLGSRGSAEVTTVVDADLDALRELKSSADFTYTSAVVLAAARGLREHPVLNASLEGDEILLHQRIHVGVAVDTPRGQTVVIVPNADNRALSDISQKLGQLSRASRAGPLPPGPIDKPTFTVTNSGVLGSLIFTPLINPPQAATLGVGKVQDTPVARDGEVLIRPVAHLCLSYDHRFVEGAEAVRFLQEVKRLLENPFSLMDGIPS